MPARKRPTVQALYKQLLATQRTIRELRKTLDRISEKLDVEPKDAIGFVYTPPDDPDEDEEDE